MLFYICTIAFILFLILNVKGKIYSFIFLLLTFPIFLLVSGLRSSKIGTDTSNYLHGFNKLKNNSWDDIFYIVEWEKGFTILNKTVSDFSNTSQSILMVTSFLILLGIFTFIYKNSPNVYFSLYLFFTLYYYFVSFNAIRQYIAISILVFGYQFIKKRRFFKFLIIILIAFHFHEAVILFLPIYFIYGIKLNLRNFTVIVLCFSIILLSFESIMSLALSFLPEYSVYVGSKFFEGSGLLTTLISGSIFLFGIVIKLMTKADKEFDFLLVIMVFSFLVSLLSMEISIFNRLGFYFSIFNIIFIPYAINCIKKIKIRILMYTIITIITLSYFTIRLLEGWQRVVPYQFLI